MSRHREIVEVFAAERDRFGIRADGRDDVELGAPPPDPIKGGDLEVRDEDANFVGEEAPGSGQAIPDQNWADAAGDALGLSYAYDEPIVPEKIDRRDNHREWELEPSRDEDPERGR
jgi:hypothetical protein